MPNEQLNNRIDCLGEYLTCNLLATPWERAKTTDNTRKQKLDAPFGPCDDDDDDNGDLIEFNDNDSHIKWDDDFIWPSNLIQLLQDIMALPCPNPSKPQFEFDLSVKAAEKNYILLMQKFGGDLHRALHAQNICRSHTAQSSNRSRHSSLSSVSTPTGLE
jgi:hypothetical protein